MKRLKKLAPLFMVGAVSILMGTSQLPNDGVFLKDMSAISIVSASVSKEAKENLKNIIILPKQNFNQTEAATIIERLNTLPSSLLQKVELKGIKVKLFTGKLTENESAKQYAGIIPRGYTSNKTWDDVPGIGGGRIVLVKIGASKKGMGHSSVNLEFHELAHSIDYKLLNNASSKKKFQKIWNEEKFMLFPDRAYFLDYAEEYFAEAFAMYYIGGKENARLLKYAPKTYKYIKSIK